MPKIISEELTSIIQSHGLQMFIAACLRSVFLKHALFKIYTININKDLYFSEQVAGTSAAFCLMCNDLLQYF